MTYDQFLAENPTSSAASAEKISSPVADTGNSGGIINALTGLLSKGVDTYVDVWGLQQKTKAIGTLYPSGQVDPATAQAQQQQASVQTQAQMITKWAPYLLVGGLVVAGVFVMIVAKSRK